MKSFSIIIHPILIFAFFLSCSSQNKKENNKTFEPDQNFISYWYDGKAEITSYELKQARYGEIRKGSAVMIFVTEDFRLDKKVKVDTQDQRKKHTSVLKLNFIKKFQTGIYDYSLMSSSFTPVNRSNFPHTLKVTNTNQDWCGHTFMQITREKKNFKVLQYSYFEAEADTTYKADAAYLEDEILNLIRLSPDLLPKGETMMIPGMISSRLRHKDLIPEKVKCSLMKYEGKEFDNKNLAQYSITYTESNRDLVIYFEDEFPYKIYGWDESYDDFGKMLTSKGRRIRDIKTDYWKKNGNEFNMMQDSLWK